MQRSQLTRLYVLAIVVTLIIFCPAFAQPKPALAPSSTHIFPAGGRRGTVVQVRVGAECIPPDTNLLIQGGGVTAPKVLGPLMPRMGEPAPRRVPTEIPITIPREWQSQLTIASDASVGPVFWNLSCASGGTGSRPFLVGDLQEFIETESNSTAERAERVTMPVTLNGQISGERDVDYFRFTVPAGKVAVCEMIAARIGSRLDPIVEVLTTEGRKVAVQQVYRGSDPVLAFRVESTGEYLLRVANVSWHGDPAHVYRINLTTQPYVHFAFPPGGQRDTTTDVILFTLTGAQGYDEIRRRVVIPKAIDRKFVFSDAEAFAGPVSLAADDLPNVVETEPNDSSSTGMKLSVPSMVNGRLLTKTDEDWFRFRAAKDQKFTITCRAYPHGGDALPVLVVTDAPGKRLVQARSVESPDGECRIEWRSPADADYLLRVSDMRHGVRGGPEFVYRLSINEAQPDFALSLASDSVNTVQGAETPVEVSLTRIGGFNGAVNLRLEGLPDGVRLKNTQIPAGKSKAKFTLAVSADMAASSCSLRLVGQAMINDHPVERTAEAKHLAVDGQGVAIGRATHDRFQLTVQHKPLFRLFCAEAYLYAHRGSVFPYLMEVERLDGFDGPILLQQGDRQNRDMDGVEILNAEIPPSKTRTIVPIYLPETMHINVQSQTQLYTQAYVSFLDKHNRKQSMLFLSEKRNMLRTLPPVVKLKAIDEQISGRPGSEIRCRFHLQRTTNFTGPMKLELIAPTEPKPFLSAGKVTIPERGTDAAVTVKVSESMQPGTKTQLKFRATGELYNNRIVVTEATIPFRLE